MIDEARTFAEQAHGQQRYGDHPYVHRLDAVAALLAPYGEEAQAIGYLHDVVEDTNVTEAEVRSRFGELIASCVSLLTDEPGTSRKERKARTYEKLSRVTGPTELALVVKAADRLANVRACVVDGNERLLDVYRSEHTAFKAAAYRTGLCDSMWIELDAALQAP